MEKYSETSYLIGWKTNDGIKDCNVRGIRYGTLEDAKKALEKEVEYAVGYQEMCREDFAIFKEIITWEEVED